MKKVLSMLWMTACFLFLSCMTGNAADYPATITSCEIDENNTSIKVKASVSSFPEDTDGYFYLFELKTYENDLGTRTDYTAWANAGNSLSFQADLNLDSSSRLYSKFAVAIKKGEHYQMVSAPHYITNPEQLAPHTYAYPTSVNKKGLLMDPKRLNEANDLGLSYASYNMPLYRFLIPSTDKNYPDIMYEYHGKNYSINGLTVAEYDNIFQQLTDQDVIITAILLNPYQTSRPELIHPLSRDSNSAIYYAFNAADADGTEYLEAVVSFLAERYSREDKKYGQVMNWIVGNEVNICKDWNYMSDVGIDIYAKEYARAFRLIYTAVKSQNANARVFTCIDQRWNRSDEILDRYYNGKDFLDRFNQSILEGGNIDWSLSHHPYPVPLTYPRFWDMPSEYKAMNLIQDNEQTPFITMANCKVLTDYLQKTEYRNPNGQVRHLIISEVGFTSLVSGTEDLQGQAAAVAYAYKIAEANDYIDAFLLFRHCDTTEEIAQGLALGLYTPDGTQKPAYQVYKYLGTSNEEAFCGFAKGLIGITDWNSNIPHVKKAASYGWNYDGIGWWYLNSDGNYPISTWELIGGKWYFFNSSGYMMTGWIFDQGKWYYLDSDGSLLTDSVTPDGYYVDSNGVLK